MHQSTTVVCPSSSFYQSTPPQHLTTPFMPSLSHYGSLPISIFLPYLPPTLILLLFFFLCHLIFCKSFFYFLLASFCGLCIFVLKKKSFCLFSYVIKKVFKGILLLSISFLSYTLHIPFSCMWSNPSIVYWGMVAVPHIDENNFTHFHACGVRLLYLIWMKTTSHIFYCNHFY